MRFEEFSFACGLHELDSRKIAITSMSFNGDNHFSMDFRYIDDPKEISATFVSNPYIPKKIICSGNRTIVFWEDGTKTIVKRGDDEENSPYHAFTAAVCKKIFGSNSATKKILKDKCREYATQMSAETDSLWADALRLLRRSRGFVDRET